MPRVRVDHEAYHQLGDGRSEAGAGTRHQNAVLRGGRDVDAGGVDMAVDISKEVGDAAKKRASASALMSPTMIAAAACGGNEAGPFEWSRRMN